MKKFINIILGFGILMLYYYISRFILNSFNITFPPAILGLVLFATSLILGIIKEDWVKDTVNILMKNMAMFLLPFWGGLIVYEKILLNNALVIILVVFITTTLIIVLTGLFVEYGLKYVRLNKIRSKHD